MRLFVEVAMSFIPQKLNSVMDCQCCCCEQPISAEKFFFTAISLDAHNNNIRNLAQNSASDYIFIIMMTGSICYLRIHENENSTTLPTDCAAIGNQLAELVQAPSPIEDLLFQVAGCE